MRTTFLAALALVPAAIGIASRSPALAAAGAEEILPGVDLSALSPPQREVVARVAREEFCYCGCPHTLAQCLHTHKECKHAPRMARLAVRLAGSGAQPVEVLKLLSEYYGSFERSRRARLDLAAFGPPRGDEKAPVALVEFSDFTCPYCQAVKPTLDALALESGGRLRLYYKPFPLAGHPRAFEAAQAAEWARDAGLFWRMVDALFANPHELSDADLASRARELGGDAAALREALVSGRHRARIAASQAEARAAGLRGTPTLYLDGRRYVLSDYSAEALRFTVEDEEEWKQHGRWARD